MARSAPPDGTQSLALIVDDPDAPRGTFVHWVVYNIPPDYNGRMLRTGESFDGASSVREGANDFGGTGYGGPCPPAGSRHRYYFRLYALDTSLDLEDGASKKQVTNAMEGHVLAETDLMGLFERK